MTNLTIRTADRSENGLISRRQISLPGVTVETPAVALPIGRTRSTEHFNPESRGINELYRQVDGSMLRTSMREVEAPIRKRFERDAAKAEEEELTLPFIDYQETGRLAPREAKHLVDILDEFGDIIPVPMMSNLVRAVDPDAEGLPPAFSSYLESVRTFIEAATTRAPNTPIMGVIPPLGWEFISELVTEYGRHDLRAFYVNFDRRKTTAATQVSMVRPLMANVAKRGIEDDVMFYAMNPDSTGRPLTKGVRPAVDAAGLGMGFDIIGGCHIPPKYPEEVFEKIEAQQPDDPEKRPFKLLDKDELVYRDIPLKALKRELPSDSGLDSERVFSRSKASPDTSLYRMQALVNQEQMALAAKALRETAASRRYQRMSEAEGMTEQAQQACTDVRYDFDSEPGQSGLSDF
jgi:hypothetical protein